MDADVHSSDAADHVVVGGCYGLILLKREELPAFKRGYLWGTGALFVLALLELAVLLAVR